MTKKFDKCPKCKGDLHITLPEHADYPLREISESGTISLDPTSGDSYYRDFVQIACKNCNSYWYSVSEFVSEAKVSMLENLLYSLEHL